MTTLRDLARHLPPPAPLPNHITAPDQFGLAAAAIALAPDPRDELAAFRRALARAAASPSR